MKRRMKKLMSLLISVSMVFSVFTMPVYATPADGTESEQTVESETTETEDNTTGAAEEAQPEATQPETTQPEETQPQTTTVEESFTTYTINANDIDVSDVTPHGVSFDEDVQVDDSNPVITTVEDELSDIKVLDTDEEGTKGLTEEQIQTVLGLYQQYLDQWEDNANLLGVQLPFFLNYNDNGEDRLGILGEMLVLAGYSVDDVRNGEYSYDDLLGMIQNFYYADKFAIKFYGDGVDEEDGTKGDGSISESRDAALKAVEESGAQTLVQKMLVLNDWIAHNTTFDMSYIMKGDTDNDDESDDPLMVAKDDQEAGVAHYQTHKHYQEIHDAMYAVYEEQITNQFRTQIEDGIKDAVYKQALEQAQAAHDDIYASVLESLVANGMDPDAEDTKNLAEEQTQAQIEQIAQDAVDDVVNNGMPATDEEGNAILDENGEQVLVPFDQVVDQQMDQPMDELGGMTPNEAVPVYAGQAAEGLTSGIIGAWEGNHIGVLAEGAGVCAGYSKAFAYLLQYMSPKIYSKTEDEKADMSISSNWKTAKELYYDDDGNLDINKDYIVDMVRITFDADVSMFGEESGFGEVHFWNAVHVGGKWYYVDPCYTDIYVECMSRDRVEIDGTMNHMYFMFSHDTAEEMYQGNMKEIATLYDGADVQDTSYEDSWYARISSNVYSDKDNFYYMYDSSDQLAMMREFRKLQDSQGSSGGSGLNEEDFAALMEGSDPAYKLVYHPITDNDIKEGGADSDFRTLIDFNPKDEDDNTLSAQVYNPNTGAMEENELITKLFAQYKEECDIYPSIKMTTALYENKLYFNLSNCILSYDLASGAVEKVKEYNTVYGKRDNSVPFGGMAFSVKDSASEADFTVENHPIAAMTIKEDGQMYVSIATNFAFISGKSGVNDISSYGYEFEESNYNPDYSTYMQGDSSEMEAMGYSSETNDNDEFMWSAVFVDTVDMSKQTSCTHSNTETVTVEPFCGRDGYTEVRCADCGAPVGERSVDEGSACEHHYIHFNETYYTKDDNGEWNKGDCYVCTVCGFAIEEPDEPRDDAEEEEKEEYEKEKAIWDNAVETAGHTYTSTDPENNVAWSQDEEGNEVATISGALICNCCDGKLLDVLLAEENKDTTSIELSEPVTLAKVEKKVSGKCDEGLTTVYTATGSTEDGKNKIVATKTEQGEAGEHNYVAEFEWTETEDEDADCPYEVTVKSIECSQCHEPLEGETEVKVSLDDTNSIPATCEEPGEEIYVATVTVKDEDGNILAEDITGNTEKREVPALGHKYECTFGEDLEEIKDADGNGTGEYTTTAVFACTHDGCESKFEGDDVAVKVEKDDDSSKEATCEEDGEYVYNVTATVIAEDGANIEPATKEYTIVKDALGHDYGEPEWTWSKDYSEATATFTCKNDKTHIETIEAKVTSETTDPTCEKDGKIVYTATCKLDEDSEDTYTDTKEETLEATGHDYGEPTWTWSEDYSTATATFTCKNDETHVKTVEATITSESSDATCEKAGTVTYTASAEFEGTTYTTDKTVTGVALGHDYGEPEWTWSKDYTEATATFTCKNDETHVKTVEAKVTSETTEPTCEKDGKIVYTATCKLDEDSEDTYTDTKEEKLEATGHDYGEPTWTWSKDYTEATATFTCKNDETHVKTVEAKVTSETTEPTCEKDGKIVYTATCKLDEDSEDTYTDTKEETLNATGHDYGEPTWTWSEDRSTAIAKFTCSKCDHSETVVATEITSSTTDPTCEVDGETVYTASVEFEGNLYTGKKEDTIEKLGHEYGDPTWTWSEDYSTATATFTCSRGHDTTVDAEVTVDSSDATCEKAGTVKYTATVKLEGKPYSDTKTVEGQSLGHDYGEPEWKWSDDYSEATATFTCSRDKNHVETVTATVESKNTPATCEVDGATVYTASVEFEGTTYTDPKTVTEEATGHNWGEWITTKEPTDSEAGEETRLCSKCNETQTREIAKLNPVSVQYQTHIQSIGWEKGDWKEDGQLSGTEGQSLRLESIRIKLDKGDVKYSGDIVYTTHVQSKGWISEVQNGSKSGTEGESKRLEAIKIYLTGEMAEHYDVYYCVHAQTYGWLNWAKNGEYAGTAGLSKRLEAIRIVLVKKGGDAPESLSNETRSYVTAYSSDGESSKNLITYRTHVQTYDWQNWKYDGVMSGTSGESKRLEGIQIKLPANMTTDDKVSGNIEYQTHVQSKGWEEGWKGTWAKNGELSGTSGQSLRLEAIQIRLTGDLEEKYDVYYCVHAQTYGWLGWAKNGNPAGTEGLAKRLEGIKIVLVEKGGEPPKALSNQPAFIKK